MAIARILGRALTDHPMALAKMATHSRRMDAAAYTAPDKRAGTCVDRFSLLLLSRIHRILLLQLYVDAA